MSGEDVSRSQGGRTIGSAKDGDGDDEEQVEVPSPRIGAKEGEGWRRCVRSFVLRPGK